VYRLAKQLKASSNTIRMIRDRVMWKHIAANEFA
jgi:hypothetical protein